MTARILIIGGYGNFGRFIAKTLASEDDIQVIIAGRNLSKAETLAAQLIAENPTSKHPVAAVAFDFTDDLTASLSKICPDIVIHTSGPFQSQNYDVAKACISQACHYIDIADGREFVAQFKQLDAQAKASHVCVCAGASSVPSLSSAIVDHYGHYFKRLETLDYAITTAHLSNLGLATTAAVLSYVGQKFSTRQKAKTVTIVGWLGLRRRKFWKLGNRLLGNCDIPDLALFPERYPNLKTMRFQAGLELKILHLILTGMSYLVSWKLFPSLRRLAPYLLKISRLFDFLGGNDSGFYMELSGKGITTEKTTIVFELCAREGDGLYIPSIPSIIMALKLARGQISDMGAFACMGFVHLDEILELLGRFNIEHRCSINS